MNLKKIGETSDKKEDICSPDGDPNKGIYYVPKFEEQFPELKPDYCNVDIVCLGETLLKRTFHYSEENIRKSCLSKQRVKEAIDTYLTKWKVDDITCECENCLQVRGDLSERDKLLKELGL